MRYLILLLIAGCTQQPTEQKGLEQINLPNVQSTAIAPNIVWYPTSDMQRYWQQYRGDQPPKGLRAFTVHKRDQILIFSPMPKRVNDQATCLLGHEILHAQFGQYHSETIE